MAKRLYVGNMSYSTTEDGLRSLFQSYGEVTSVSIISDRETGKARGFGFVEMSSDDAAVAAMSALNGQNFEGRQLKVNEALERPHRPKKF
jgi:RNA recognition motif-containing protein